MASCRNREVVGRSVRRLTPLATIHAPVRQWLSECHPFGVSRPEVTLEVPKVDESGAYAGEV